MRKIVILFISLLFAIGAQADIYQITANSLNVRNAPSTSGKVLGKMSKGQEIDVKEIKNGFAAFDYKGTTGYASSKYMKKIADSAPKQTVDEDTEVVEQVNVDWANDSHATVYLFYDLKHYIESMPVTINGNITFGMEGEASESKVYGKRFSKSMRKINVSGEGRMHIAIDFYWAQKPYHSDLTLDVVDGGVYYVKIHLENLWNAMTKKRMGIYLKQLTPKEGQKELKKKDKKYVENPEINITL